MKKFSINIFDKKINLKEISLINGDPRYLGILNQLREDYQGYLNRKED